MEHGCDLKIVKDGIVDPVSLEQFLLATCIKKTGTKFAIVESKVHEFIQNKMKKEATNNIKWANYEGVDISSLPYDIAKMEWTDFFDTYANRPPIREVAMDEVMQYYFVLHELNKQFTFTFGIGS